MGGLGDANGPASARRPLRIATLGAASSANKGAASMLQAVVDNLGDHLGPCRLDVLTTYPEEDAAEPPRTPAGMIVRIIPCRPRQLLFPMLPLALMAGLARWLGGTGRAFCVTPALRSLAEADLVLDLAGISFSDHRGLPTLAYNALMTGIPLLVAGPVVKCAQALGPFGERLNRAAARVILPRLAAVVARGDDTAANLRALGLTNVHQGSDVAFLMTVPAEARTEGDRLIHESVGHGPFIAVCPSAVLEARCRRRGLDYTELMAALLRRLADAGNRVLLLPHAARPGHRPGRMNDLPLIRTIHGKVARSSCTTLDLSLPPEVLRALVARAELLVTARFHGLISALCEGTPVLVTGWGHKYGEVLRDFDLEEWSVDLGTMDAEALHARVRELSARAPGLRSRIRDRVPAVRVHARRNFEILPDLLGPDGRPS